MVNHLLLQIISAQGELNASRALKEAAGVIAASPTALQLRYLQTLSVIAAERSSSIFFPIPIDILSGMVSAMHWYQLYAITLNFTAGNWVKMAVQMMDATIKTSMQDTEFITSCNTRAKAEKRCQ